ncbi:MAG: DUF2846 domain-containing protein [Acidobacteria bacterium]|jgi:hypothetical protein|nr:DUF2846 domain-containing protein [Acidobacteriota bacterium]
MKRQSLFVSLAILGSALAAGTSVGAAAKDKAPLPRAEVQPDKALIYVARPAAMGFAVPIYFFANEQFLGVNHGNGYFWAYVPPGRYLFWSKAENVHVLPPLEVEAGKTYYFRQKTVPGWIKARTAVERIDPAQGEALLNECQKLSEPTDEQRRRGEEHAKESWPRAQKEAAKEAAAESAPAGKDEP